MYAGYALSSIISPSSGMTEIRAAGVIPALVAVLNTSKVTHDAWLRAACSVGYCRVGSRCAVGYPTLAVRDFVLKLTGHAAASEEEEEACQHALW